MKGRVVARPVLKWAGGKRRLLDSILSLLPKHIDTYFEPFVGGGAVFFGLAAERRFERAVLADSNPELVSVYRALQEDVDGLIEKLRGMNNDPAEYYRVRAQRPRSVLGRAARVIYLNKTGYNGLYRVNSKGQFNVPFGRYVRPKICDEKNLRAAARTLQNVTLEVSDFEAVCARAKPGDAVYLDPPYAPLSSTSNFTAYDRSPFGEDEQRRLAEVFADLHRRGVLSVLSNSKTELTCELYGEWEHTFVKMRRPINSNPSRRGAVDELLTVNEPMRPRARSRRQR